MRTTIYFPGFEPSDENWLKFALLYFDKLKPIVPHAADHKLTDQFLDVKNYTNLIDLRRPTFPEGEAATADAIEHVQRILKKPSLYTTVFDDSEIDKTWRNPTPGEVVELWSDKYSDEWTAFCDDEKLAQPSDHGVYISESLADVYMNILANCIADVEDVPAVSDESIHRGLSFRLRSEGKCSFQKEQQTLEAAFPILLPANLSEIELTTVMKLRSSAGFEDKLRAFHDAMDAVTSAVERGRDAAVEMAKALDATHAELTDTFARLSTGTLSLGFAMWLVASGAGFDSLDAIRQVLAGTAFSVVTVVTLRNTWTNTRPSKLARQYVADVQSLFPK